MKAPTHARSACCAGNECGACFSYGLIGGSIYGVGAFFFGCLAAGLVPLVGARSLHFSLMPHAHTPHTLLRC